ncbi:MAG: chromate efflux transporter [Chloroflexi bacterium]|nr:chromate efflux transporter [Chloroflexota bacterium]
MGSGRERWGALREIAALFLKLGCIGFGGPAAHIAMMRDEVVRRRGWLDDQAFLDMVGVTNLIPGPNSTEMAIQLGHRRAGWPGLLLGGALFILPAMLIVLALAAVYVQYGATPQAGALLYGVKPVIIAIILHALWSLGRRAIKNLGLAAVGVAVVAGYFLGLNEIALLFAGGAVVMAAHLGRRAWLKQALGAVALPLGLPLMPLDAYSAAFSLTALFLNFLKIGSVLYGSGYVLLAFLQADFVERLGWLTEGQLLDAIAVGQFTPGPVLTTATFVGYVVGGWPAAILATVGIFLPSFIFVALLVRVLPWLRRASWTGAALDGVNVASLGLMAGVAWQLGRAAIVDPFTIVLGLASLALVARTRLNSAWLVLGGAAAGLVFRLVLGIP